MTAAPVTETVTVRERWSTPQDLFDHLDAEFHFTLDAAALPENAKCGRYFTPADDGLSQPWTGTVYVNPPYNRDIGKWLEKGFNSAQYGATVVTLVPSRTGARWWHEWVLKGEIRYLPGRLRFGDSGKDAPFDSVLVIFRK